MGVYGLQGYAIPYPRHPPMGESRGIAIREDEGLACLLPNLKRQRGWAQALFLY